MYLDNFYEPIKFHGHWSKSHGGSTWVEPEFYLFVIAFKLCFNVLYKYTNSLSLLHWPFNID